MGLIMEYCETLNICNTYQFKIIRAMTSPFSMKRIRGLSRQPFETDLKSSYDLGVRIAKKAKDA